VTVLGSRPRASAPRQPRRYAATPYQLFAVQLLFVCLQTKLSDMDVMVNTNSQLTEVDMMYIKSRSKYLMERLQNVGKDMTIIFQ
jgi:hypothetical protein